MEIVITDQSIYELTGGRAEGDGDGAVKRWDYKVSPSTQNDAHAPFTMRCNIQRAFVGNV